MINLQIIGNLTKDAQTTQSQNNGTVFNKFRVAVNEGSGQNQNAIFIDVMQKVFNPEDNRVLQYLVKGKKVFVQGRISVDAWVNEQGQPLPSITIWTDKLELLGGNENGSQPQPQGNAQYQQRPPQAAPQCYQQNNNGQPIYQQERGGYQQQQFQQTQQQPYGPQYPPQNDPYSERQPF